MAKEAKRNTHVLIVEDDPVVCELTANLLEKEGNLTARCANNGDDAVREWRAGTFDVILMDIKMDGLDGVETAKIIREFEKMDGRERTRIIAYSAVADRNAIDQGYRDEFDDFIAKPTTLSEILDTITRSLSCPAH